MAFHSDPAVVEAVARRSESSAAVVHLKMKRGLDSLATIAATAPWVGLFGTVFGLMNSFRGTTGSRSTIMAAISAEISQSLVPTALGLLVAISAFWFYNYLSSEMETFDTEMQNASLELVNRLILYRAHGNP